MSTPEMILYGKADCGLCDEAQQLLAAAGLEARHVDVEADDELMAQYGLRIPVLADGQGRELDWPFDELSLADWLHPG